MSEKLSPIEKAAEALTCARDFMLANWPKDRSLDVQYLAGAQFQSVEEAIAAILALVPGRE